MKRINIAGLTLPQLQEMNNFPKNLKWRMEKYSKLPTSYSVHLVKNEKGTKTLVALSDAFGGDIAWALYDGDIPTVSEGKEESLTQDERDFLQKNYPEFLLAIDTIEN